jgi:DNA-binding MarR family transcriptional regulator
MSEPRWLTPDELHAWRWLSALTLILPGKLEESLQQHGLTFFEYSMLAGLSGAPDKTLPMSTLAQIANGSLSRLSHAARRLESRGWIVRRPSPADGRVTLATLTDDGAALLVAAAPAHVEAVQQSVFDVLTPEQVTQLDVISAALVRNLLPGPPPWERD